MFSLVGKTVLIVDDDADMRRLLKRSLEGSGLVCREAGSVDEAIKCMETEIPHVMMLDLRMPEKDGFILLRQRRDNPLYRKVPVIVLSASKAKPDVMLAMALGASTYLIKPYNLAVVLTKIKQAMIAETTDKLRVKFPDGIPIQVTSPASVVKINDEQMLIQAPVKILQDTKVLVKSDLLKRMGFENEAFKWSPLLSSFGDQGQYVSKVTFVGMNANLLNILRQFFKNWKVEP